MCAKISGLSSRMDDNYFCCVGQNTGSGSRFREICLMFCDLFLSLWPLLTTKPLGQQELIGIISRSSIFYAISLLQRLRCNHYTPLSLFIHFTTLQALEQIRMHSSRCSILVASRSHRDPIHRDHLRLSQIIGSGRCHRHSKRTQLETLLIVTKKFCVSVYVSIRRHTGISMVGPLCDIFEGNKAVQKLAIKNPNEEYWLSYQLIILLDLRRLQ